MDDWTDYVFRVAECILSEKVGDELEDTEAFAGIKAFCIGRTYNIWGAPTDDLDPTAVFHYDVERWMSGPLSAPLFEYRLPEPKVFEFGFSQAKQAERAALIQRYRTTPTGIGRIIISFRWGAIGYGVNRSLLRPGRWKPSARAFRVAGRTNRQRHPTR